MPFAMPEPPKADTCSPEEPAPQTTPPRKRQAASDDSDPLPSKRARLTRENLARFDKMGSSHRGAKKGSTHHDSTTKSSSSTKSLSTTAPGFAVQARNNGILDPRGSRPPANLEEIRRRLACSRATASPPASVYEDYVNAVEGADNEATMVYQAGGKLLKEYPGRGYKKMFNQAFTGYPKDLGFNDGLSAPQPDYVEGLEMEEYRPFPVDQHVPGAVLYQDNPRSVTLPHVAGEWKGPDGSMAQATRQSAYDGAALVFARNQALAHMGQTDPPGHASIMTFTTNGTHLNFHAHYAAPAEDGSLEYHQYAVQSTSLVRSHQEHKEGRRELRNAQDHARKQSYDLKDQLKEHWKQHRRSLHAAAAAAAGRGPAGTLTEDGYEIVEHQPTPPTSSQPKHGASHHSQHAQHAHSTPSSSKAPPSTHSSSHGSGQKRKASSSPGSSSGSSHHSKYKNYWAKDKASGRFYHKHSDGTISWLEDDDDH